MSFTGEVNITVVDGQSAIVAVPGQSVQAVIGCAGAGTVGQVVPTRSLNTLRSTFSNGPLMHAAGMALQSSLTNGGGVGPTVLAVRATTATAGAIRGASNPALTVTGATNASPIVITTSAAHGLITGDVVTVASVGGNTAANGTFVITVLSSTTFSLNNSSGNAAYTSGGTVTFTGTVQTGTGRTVITYTGTPTDDYYPVVKCLKAGTVGVTGITVAVSLDAGRNFGPAIALGTSTTLALLDAGGLDTGLTANFTADTIVVGDQAVCSTVGPLPDTTGVVAALNALVAYAAISGTSWGSIHIVGTFTGANATTLQTTLDSMATNYVFTRAIISARDASPPTAWGGTGETEATWQASVLADFAATTARRQSVAAGHYNMPSAFPTQFASTPSYRRPLAWAYAARETVIPTQRHAGKVADGSLSQIVVSPTTDPSDGFVYHNEYLNPGLDYLIPGGAGRFTTARTHNGLQGFFITNPLSLAPVGSDFTLLPQGLVMDVACTIAHGALLQFVNADLQTAANGTLLDKDATTVRNAVADAINANMKNIAMISGFTVAVDQTSNMQVTKTLSVTITILGVAYILQVNVTLGFANQLAA